MSKKLTLFILLAIFFMGCATVPLTGRKQLSLVPESQIVQMSADSYKELIEKSELSKYQPSVEMVQKVGKRIAVAAEKFLSDNELGSDIKNYNWEFNLIKDSQTVNAFCMPGGKVAVYTGILPLTKDENGLAVVVGHEVAHAIAKHGSERMSQLLLTQLGGIALSEALKTKSEQTQQLMLMAYGVGSQVGVLLPYSRNHEYEADQIGLVFMAMAGYNLEGAVEFWERMNALDTKKPPEFMSTHPADENRIAKIKSEIPQALEYYQKN
ncbi:MAG: M48 family metallopeptidase [Endomicrobiales bacterium]|nr:M48 family metallopeptidase [Endomicrobiales bacterium]